MRPASTNSAKPDREQITDQARIGHVGSWKIRIEGMGDDAGQHEDKRDEQFEEAGKDGSLLALVDGARPKDALHVGLVHAPIEHSAK